jgi:hypothetical protein
MELKRFTNRIEYTAATKVLTVARVALTNGNNGGGGAGPC